MNLGKKINILKKISAAGFSCMLAFSCTQSDSNKKTVSDDSFHFIPIYRGASGPTAALGVPLPPINLQATPEPGKIKLSWTIPKTYKSSKVNIGYRIFQKIEPGISKPSGWDFTSAASEDWALSIATVKAVDCDDLGSCQYEDDIGGPLLVSYGVFAYWDISDFNSTKSVLVSTAVTSKAKVYDFSFDVGFMDTVPNFLIGNIVSDADRVPGNVIFNFDADEVPWFLLDASQSQKTAYSWARLSAPLFPGLSYDSLSLIMPDSGFHRAVYMARGDLRDCNAFPEKTRELCYQVLISNQFSSYFPLGQETFLKQSTFYENPLPASRKFNSRSTSVQISASGKKYTFIADEQRILIRVGDIFICNNDPGEEGDAVYGPEGYCGFKWSIGTYSPRQRCARKPDGSLLTGSSPCTDIDFSFSGADTTPPTNYSLRNPGVPKIVGNNLYIPDSGNARILRIKDFEKALESCGKLIKTSSSELNRVCEFDMVLGQIGSSEGNADRFSKRNCLKGGEQGGKNGLIDVSESEAFIDPLGNGGSGGAACRLDMLVENIAGENVKRRYRQAGDFRSSFSSHISADTGLLADVTRRAFRAPMHLEFDDKGYLYVLDHGITRARSSSGDNESTLPPRIMVWRKDPFSFQKCVPTDPLSSTPSCAIDADSVCHGEGCIDRECVGAECNATWFLGQPAELFGFTYQAGQNLGFDINPEAYYPITAFSVGKNGDLKGVWAVTGRDSRVLHWKNISQTEKPEIHNAITGSTGEIATFKRGIFSGINVDNIGGMIILWDTKLNVGFSWVGQPKK